MNAPVPELQEADRAMTQQVESWDGTPSLGHYTALEALILIRLRLHGHALTPAQPPLFDAEPTSPEGAPTTIPPPGPPP